MAEPTSATCATCGGQQEFWQHPPHPGEDGMTEAMRMLVHPFVPAVPFEPPAVLYPNGAPCAMCAERAVEFERRLAIDGQRIHKQYASKLDAFDEQAARIVELEAVVQAAQAFILEYDVEMGTDDAAPIIIDLDRVAHALRLRLGIATKRDAAQT